jgi:hypothetical protein
LIILVVINERAYFGGKYRGLIFKFVNF